MSAPGRSDHARHAPPRPRAARRAATIALLLVLALGACGRATTGEGTAAIPSGVPTCTPTDQDGYVYRPARLDVLAPCVRVTGTILASSTEADGDVHLNVRLDDPYGALLRPGNAFEGGALIAEPVCQIAPPQADAIRICAADATPLGAVPPIGAHVWLEGRWVIDRQHHAWAELHPLYRWGPVGP